MAATWAIWCSFRREFQAKLDFEMLCTLGPDGLELIIFDITGKKIDNHPSRLIIQFFL